MFGKNDGDCSPNQVAGHVAERQKTLSICPEGDCPCLKVSVITPLDTTMPSDASAVVPVNVANGCLIHKRCVSFFNAVTVSSNDAVILFVRSPAF